MDATAEQRLLKCLLEHEFYSTSGARLSDELFSSTGRIIFRSLGAAHETYKTDISVSDLKQLVWGNNPALTQQNRRLINNVFDGIEDEKDVNSAVAADLLCGFMRRQAAYNIGELAVRAINNNEDTFDEIAAIAGNTESTVSSALSFTEASTDFDEVMEAADPKNLFQFRIPCLRDHIAGAGRGHHVVVMARPEVGKSGLVADCAVGWVEQGLRVDYFGNEEPAHKIILNLARAKFGMTDNQLRVAKAKRSFDYATWKDLRSRFRMFDCVGITVEELQDHAIREAPDVIIADQLDKFGISGTHSSKTEKLGNIYVNAREIAKRNNLLMVSVCQASADAQDHRRVDYSMADYSKTGKAAEADLFIGIGDDPGDETHMRYITISKNKIDGVKGMYETYFRPDTNKWDAVT